MEYKILSKENKEGNCEICNNKVYEMLFVKTNLKQYIYTCLECLGEGESKKEKIELKVEYIDEEKIAREKILEELVSLAEEDELVFDNPKLNVIHKFKDEIIDGVIDVRLEKYIKFNGNDIKEVLKLRDFAIEANGKEGTKFKKLVNLYINSRVKKLTNKDRNNIKILMTDRDVQELLEDYRIVWEKLPLIQAEIERSSSFKKYDNINEMIDIMEFYRLKSYMTQNQLRRLRSFYYEMRRRNK